ncbi:MAG: hypothetical protein A4E43_01168 [Methanosaeta sp. PtaB.Bin005]|nr:MAG: hypothetical protein A4E43_01168 [Methanosaeta sp. PtaB.Bin005]
MIIKNIFLVWTFFLASSFWASTICLPLPAGTTRTLGVLLSSGLA